MVDFLWNEFRFFFEGKPDRESVPEPWLAHIIFHSNPPPPVSVISIIKYPVSPLVLQNYDDESFNPVWRIHNVLMRIRIPLFKLMRIRIQILFTRVRNFFSSNLQLWFPKSSKTCHV